jgi:hypothetical protein
MILQGVLQHTISLRTKSGVLKHTLQVPDLSGINTGL